MFYTTSVASNGSWLAASPSQGQTPTSVTFSAASVTVSVSPGQLAVGSYQGSVKINSTSIPVTLTVTGGAPAGLQIVSGNNQTTTVGQPFPAPLVVEAVDAQNNPISGATIAWTVPSGAVTLSSATATSDANGMATITLVAGNSAGNVAVTATTASLAATFNLTVNPAASSVTLKSSANPSSYGQPLTLTANVSPSTATGTVTFKDGTTNVGIANLTGGAATLTLSTLSAGTHPLMAVYSGDTTYAASSSPVLNQVVSPGTAAVTLTSSSNPSASGQTLTLTASVTPSSASGSITFNDGSNTLGSAALSGGTASLTLTSLSTGVHSITAVYPGDINFAAANSAVLTQTVNGVGVVSPCTPSFTATLGQAPPNPILCQFTSVVAAQFTVSTSASWLNVSPSSGSLGQTPTSLTISVDASALSAGAYTGSFTITGSQLGSMTIAVQLTVKSGAASMLIATPTSLNFSYQQNSAASAPQTLTVSSTASAQLPFLVTVAGGSWLVAGINAGTSPGTFNVTVNSQGLSPAIYTGTIAISSPGLPSVTVNTTLTVTAPAPPQLTVNAQSLNLTALQGGSPAMGEIQVSNSGGGVLTFTAAASGANWLSVLPASGPVDNTAANFAAAPLTVQCDPTALDPGTYQGSITVTAAGTTSTIPVTFSVGAPSPVILVSQTGLVFTAVAQGGAPLPQQIGILNAGTGTLNWTATASTLSGGNWLLVSTPGGLVQRPYLDVSLIGVAIDPNVLATLAPGDYYGQIQLADPAQTAVNSPQLVTIILTVLPAGSDPGPEVYPSSLIFTGLAGVSPASQSLAVGIRKAAADQFLTAHAGSGFTYSPLNSPVLPNQPVTLQVTPDFSAVSPGEIDHGAITLQFSDGTVRTINLLTLVAPAASNSCASLSLQWRTPALPNFSIVQGQAQTLEVQIVDSCGNLIGPVNPQNALAVASFSNQDPSVQLVHVGNGIWSGTWKPVNSSSGPVVVKLTALNTSSTGLASALYGTVLPGATPIVTAGTVLQAASPAPGKPIAPGSLITLPLSGTQIFLGSEPLPLTSSGSGQVSAQIPYDVPVNTQLQLTVRRDNLQSLPAELVIAVAQPGIFTVDSSGSGQGVIFNSDGVTVAQPGTPAAVGETITILCAGLGAVNAAVPAGTTVNPVAVTIAGLDANASVGTLVPGQPGVYQIAATVPAGVSGDTLPVVVTVAGQASPAVTMAVQ